MKMLDLSSMLAIFDLVFGNLRKFTDENCACCMKDAESMLPCFSAKCVPGRSPKSGVVVR